VQNTIYHVNYAAVLKADTLYTTHFMYICGENKAPALVIRAVKLQASGISVRVKNRNAVGHVVRSDRFPQFLPPSGNLL